VNALRFTRLATFAWACAFAAGLAPSAFAGIVYKMTNDPTVQNGWALSGTITVSRTGTNLTQYDITGWAYTVSRERDSYTYSSTDSGSLSQTLGQLLATDTQLILRYSNPFALFGNHLGFRTQFGATSLAWDTYYFGKSYDANDYYNGNDLSFWGTQDFPLTTADGWVIGAAAPSAVPEIDPATGGSALSLVAGVLAIIEQRRRRATLVA